MARNVPLETSNPQSIEEAWHAGDELEVARAVVTKYARVLDMTDSGRDIKPLATGMFEAIERVHALEAAGGDGNTPFEEIIRQAEAALNG